VDETVVLNVGMTNHLFLGAGLIAGVVNKNDNPDPMGDVIRLELDAKHKTSIWFGLSGILNMEIVPGESKRIALPIYRSSSDHRPTAPSVRFKYCAQ